MQRIFFRCIFRCKFWHFSANRCISNVSKTLRLLSKGSNFFCFLLSSSAFSCCFYSSAVSVILLFVFELSYLHKSLRHFPGKLQQAFHLDCTLHNLLRYDFSPDKCILVSRFLQLAGLECVLLPDKYFQNTAVHNLVFPIQIICVTLPSDWFRD